MSRAPGRTVARALVVMTAGALLVGCASVLGVDKDFTLASEDGGGAADAGQAVDAGGSFVAGEISCAPDAAPCQADAQECCYGRSMGTELLCVASGPSDPCPEGTDIRCDDPSDCASGDVCCISLDTSNDILGTACATKCDGSQTMPQLALCAPGGAPCAAGSCQPLTLNLAAPTFYSCK